MQRGGDDTGSGPTGPQAELTAILCSPAELRPKQRLQIKIVRTQGSKGRESHLSIWAWLAIPAAASGAGEDPMAGNAPSRHDGTMKAAVRVTSFDVLAAVPLLCVSAMMIFVALAYAEVGHWPVYSQPDPKDVGFALPSGVRIGAILQFLIPLIAVPLAFIAVVIVCWTTVDEIISSKSALRWRKSVRGILQVVVCVGGFGLLLHLLSSLSVWLMD